MQRDISTRQHDQDLQPHASLFCYFCPSTKLAVREVRECPVSGRILILFAVNHAAAGVSGHETRQVAEGQGLRVVLQGCRVES